MKKPEKSSKAPAAKPEPLAPQKHPSGAQTGPTASREKVREVAHRSSAPRQSMK